MVASTVIAGNQEPADRIYRGLAGFLKCNNLEWLFRLCLVIAIGSLLAGLWQKGVMKRFEDAVDHKLDELGEKIRISIDFRPVSAYHKKAMNENGRV